MASMKTKMVLLVIMATLCSIASGSQDYYKEFHRLFSQANNEDMSKQHRDQFEKEYKDYLESLTAEQAFQAAKQYWLYIEKETNFSPRDVYEDVPWEPAILFNAYLTKGEVGFDKIENVLQEVSDVNNNVFWRAQLVSFLGNTKWLKKITIEQLELIMQTLSPIVTSSQDRSVRIQSIQKLDNLIEEIDKRYLSSEPVVQKNLKKGKPLRAIIKLVKEGKIKPSPNYTNARTKALAYYDQFAKQLIKIINNTAEHQYLIRSAISEVNYILQYQQISSEVEVKNGLKTAVQNYSKYSEKTWYRFLLLIKNNPDIGDINDIGEQMLNKTEGKTVYKNIKRILNKR